MKLWQKGITNHSDMIESFTVGRDREWDLLLAQSDVIGSMAHTRMLKEIGLLSADELCSIQKGLKNIYGEIQAGTFKIDEQMEDIHSQIEFMLTERIGEAGKKIHSGRSRNDQVLTDIKLFCRMEIKKIVELTELLFHQLISLSESHKDKLMPGYTHLQLAMPSSFGLWFAAYAESLSDDLDFLFAAYQLSNKNPLGSGAGYGSSFPLDRELTTSLLGFDSLHYNVVNSQMSRGKTEKGIAMAMASIAATLSKMSMDICLYLNPHFGFISFPDELTTGSSIMPHKKNPDVFELIRAKCNRLQALPNELTLLLSNLPSGYHRDLQLSKECLFPAFTELKSCLHVMTFMLQHIEVKDHLLEKDVYNHLFSVEEVNREVLQGVSFREAYKKTGMQIESGNFNPQKNINHQHIGSIGNLCNDKIVEVWKRKVEFFNFSKMELAIKNLETSGCS